MSLVDRPHPVLNGCYNFLKFTTCTHYFRSPIREAAFLFTGLMHDVDHPGRNNEFMKNSFSSLSITYNYQSDIYIHH